MMRMRLLITAALQGVWPGLRMLERADRKLAESGISPENLQKEAAAEAYATRARHALVYDHVEIAHADLLRASTQSRVRGGKLDPASLRAGDTRLRRHQGASMLAALLERVRANWPIERSAAPHDSAVLPAQ